MKVYTNQLIHGNAQFLEKIVREWVLYWKMLPFPLISRRSWTILMNIGNIRQ